MALIFSLLALSEVYARTARDSAAGSTSDDLLLLFFDDLSDPEAEGLFSETVTDLRARPYDLSDPDERILEAIPTLTELESMKIRLLNKAASESDVRRILSENLYNRARPFLSLSPQPKYTLEVRSRMGADPAVTSEEEYAEDKYHGSSVKSSNLLRVYTDLLQAGIVQSKDAGEPLFLDHVGGYCALAQPIELSESFSVQRAVAGDYAVGYGEGLILIRNYARSKSGDAITPLGVNATGIGNYLSTSAYRYYRGGALSLALDQTTLDLFYSNRFVDATTSDSGTITSLSYTGYHRTASEQERRLSTRQSVTGANAAHAFIEEDDATLRISATGYYLVYEGDVVSSDSLKTRFRGNDLTAGSLSAMALIGNYSVRAEVARTASDAAEALAATATLLARPFERIECAVNVRFLPENFLSPLGGVFGDNASDVQNETGGYLGLRATLPGDAVTLEGYADHAERLERTPAFEHTLTTEDFRIKGTWSPRESPFHCTLESRYRVREELTAVRSDTVEAHAKINVRFRPAYLLSEKLRLSVQTEFVRYAEPDLDASLGMLAGAGVSYKLIDELSLAANFNWYSTDSYDSRIYITEPEVPGAGGFTFLYGDGVRYSALVSGVLFDKLHLHAKFSESRFFSPSTQADEVNTFLTLQAELRL